MRHDVGRGDSVIREIFPQMSLNTVSCFDQLARVPAHKVVAQTIRCLVNPQAEDSQKLEAAVHLTCLFSLGHITGSSIDRSLRLIVENSRTASAAVKSKLAELVAYFDPTRERASLDGLRLTYLQENLISDTALIALLRAHYPYKSQNSIAPNPLSEETKKAIFECLFKKSPEVIAETVELVAIRLNAEVGFDINDWDSHEFCQEILCEQRYAERLNELQSSRELSNSTIRQIRYILKTIFSDTDSEEMGINATPPKLPTIEEASSSTTLATHDLISETLRHSVPVTDFFNRLPKKAIVVVRCETQEDGAAVAKALGKATSARFRVIAPTSCGYKQSCPKFHEELLTLGQAHSLYFFNGIDVGTNSHGGILRKFIASVRTNYRIKKLLKSAGDEPVIIFGQIANLKFVESYIKPVIMTLLTALKRIHTFKSIIGVAHKAQPSATCFNVYAVQQDMLRLVDPKSADGDLLSSTTQFAGGRVVDLLSAQLGKLPLRPEPEKAFSLPLVARASAILLLSEGRKRQINSPLRPQYAG